MTRSFPTERLRISSNFDRARCERFHLAKFSLALKARCDDRVYPQSKRPAIRDGLKSGRKAACSAATATLGDSWIVLCAPVHTLNGTTGALKRWRVLHSRPLWFEDNRP